MPHSDFDFAALFAALDERRRARGLSWQQVGWELRPRVSTSTILRTARGGSMEADGILSMIRWLGGVFATFTTGLAASTALPLTDAHPEPFRRFVASAVYAELDRQRNLRDLTWAQVAAEIGGVEAGVLANLGRRSRMRVPSSCESRRGSSVWWRISPDRRLADDVRLGGKGR